MRAPRRARAEQKGGGALLSWGAAEGSPHRRGALRHRRGERETDGGYDVVRRRAARVDGDTEAGGDQIGRDGELVGREWEHDDGQTGRQRFHRGVVPAVADGHVAGAQRSDLRKEGPDETPAGERPEVGKRRDARGDHRGEVGATERVGDRAQDVGAGGEEAAEGDVRARAARRAGVELGVAWLATDAWSDERRSARDAGSGQAAGVVDESSPRSDSRECALNGPRVRRELEQRLVEPACECERGTVAQRAQLSELVLLRESRRPPPVATTTSRPASRSAEPTAASGR